MAFLRKAGVGFRQINRCPVMRYLALTDMPKALRHLLPIAGRAPPGATAPTRREQRRHRATALLFTLAASGSGLALLLVCGGR